MMSPIWLRVFVLLAIMYSVYGGLGSVVSPSCPIKCDVFVEVQAIRQMVNQESLIRMGIDAQTQELRQTVADVMTKLQQIYSSLESTSSSQQTRLEEGISTVTKRVEELNRSVLDVDTRLGQINPYTAASTGQCEARCPDTEADQQSNARYLKIYHSNLTSM